MMSHDHHVPHEDEQREVIDEQLARSSDVGVLADQEPAAGANPTKAEYDDLIVSHNKVLEVLRDAGLIPTA